ncbi:MAG: hypothetical protein F6K63_26025 [Moorea sp. SIO1G6]|uniref:hypothetical protein n=1 Tax=Moorena sp. SIO1G6 TaxID=2607840 RepID=UPI0013BFDDC1|nr:hypothetical protein [Moorena sp. SIO1G6]NET67653.1 hypothetical protein [Moorena sp. SIO1G6]
MTQQWCVTGRAVPTGYEAKNKSPPNAPYSRFPIPDSRFPIPDSRFPIPYSLLSPCLRIQCISQSIPNIINTKHC